jgi:myo-inositol-1(or 4)-monophosphatase
LQVPETDRALLVAAVEEAAALANSFFYRADVESWDKSPNNPVSEADLAVNALLKARLLGARPDYGWLSEETADNADRLGKRRVWIVDPIDGTRDFLRGRTGWAVSVALVEDGVPVLGALGAPARSQFFIAEAGRGAWMNDRRISVSDCADIAHCRLPADPGTVAAKWWPERWGPLTVEKPNGLALRIAKVASDEADAFFEGRPMGEWDIAAAALIIAEAGGIVTDRDGHPLVFNRPDPKLRGVVAATPLLHAEVLRRVQAGVTALQALRVAATRPSGSGP